jgi:alpha-glucosidase (family GH31 glycosyl hydrolase)
MYTCLYEVSQNGGSCIDPLFYYYPEDDNLYTDTSSHFMVGGAIKVSPVLEELADTVTEFGAYFPKGSWVSLYNFGDVVVS